MTLELREVVSVDIPVPLSKVWAYLRDPALVRRWYGWDHDGLDAQARAFVDTAVEAQDVVGDSAIHTLSWPHHDRLTLRSAAHEPRHTRLTVTRRSHQGMATFDGVRDEIDEGWVAYAHQLQFALAVHPDQERRTLSTFGLPSGDRGDRLLDRAGLVGIRGVPVGGHVQARRPDGTLLGGTLVYETPLQLGPAPARDLGDVPRPPGDPRRAHPAARHRRRDPVHVRARRRDVRAGPRALVPLVGDGPAARVVARQLSLSCHSPDPPAGRNPSATLMESM